MRSLRTVSELTEELRVLPTGMRIIAIDADAPPGRQHWLPDLQKNWAEM